MSYVPPGFVSSDVINGLHTAMAFGEPNQVEDKATFFTVTQNVDSATAVDGEGVPFAPTSGKRTVAKSKKVVKCAYKLDDYSDEDTSAGIMRPTRAIITLLDDEYQQVKGFSYVTIGGDAYYYRFTEAPVALGNIDIWTVHCVARRDR